MENMDLVKFFNKKRQMAQFVAQHTIADLELFSDNFSAAIEEAKILKIIEEEKEQEKTALLTKLHEELAAHGLNIDDLLKTKPKATPKKQSKRKPKYGWIEMTDGIEVKKTWSGVGKMPTGFSNLLIAENKNPLLSEDREEWLLTE